MLNEEAGKLSIVADVPLEIPKASGMPMMHVEAGKFSQEQVYTFLIHFARTSLCTLSLSRWISRR